MLAAPCRGRAGWPAAVLSLLSFQDTPQDVKEVTTANRTHRGRRRKNPEYAQVTAVNDLQWQQHLWKRLLRGCTASRKSRLFASSMLQPEADGFS